MRVRVLWIPGAAAKGAAAVAVLAAVILLFARAAPVMTTPLAELLSGRTVLIDAGHGGPDPGCVRAGLVEKDLTLDVARRLSERFRQAAMRPVLTRTGDADLGDANLGNLRQRKRDDLRRRAGLALEHRAEVMVSIHANSFPSPLWSGAQVFHYPGDAAGRSLARTLQDALVEELGPNVRREKEGDFYLLAQAKVPAAMVEVGFLSNPREAVLLSDPAYRDRVATAIFHGVVRYLAEAAGGGGRAPVQETRGENPHREEWRRRWQAVSDRGPDEVVLYFAGPTNGADWLTPELRQVKGFAVLPPAERVRAALRELARGPGPGSALLPVVPVGTRVRGVSLVSGEVAVDLSPEFARALTGGHAEALAVYAVVNTVAELAPGCRVRLTVGGVAPDLGHLTAPPAFSPAPAWTLPGRDGLGGADGAPGAAGRRLRWWTKAWPENFSVRSSRSAASPSVVGTPWCRSSSGRWWTAAAG